MKRVYSFSAKKTEGNRLQKQLLGGKGANLAEMCAIGLPVPPGFTVSTEACLEYQKNPQLHSDLKKEVEAALKEVEALVGKKFGDEKDPLLFSVRSGAAASMPGMMDTILNLGLNEKTVVAMGKAFNNERFAWDAYRRFIQMYANVVMNFNTSILESLLEKLKEARGAQEDVDLKAEDLKKLSQVFKETILLESGQKFPDDPYEQLWKAIEAVFKSWNNPRARKYREIHHLSHNMGTAVNVQSMVFGNLGDTSATGVCFTRDPSTGEKIFFGEFLINAQGEDVVAGIRTPAPLNHVSKNDSNKHMISLEEHMPKAYAELVEVYKKLEHHYKDMQDIEFTIEREKLYMLQTRNAKRTAQAAVKVAVDLVKEGILTKKEAIMMVQPETLNQLLHPRLDPKAKKILLAKGLPASPGAASGEIVFDSDKAQELADAGKKVLLVRHETSPEDIHGMNCSQGILTAKGGMTSHAAVVARGMGKPCVAGCSALHLDAKRLILTVSGKEYSQGDYLTIDGATGEVFEGQIPTTRPELGGDFKELIAWADEFRKLRVRTNADNPQDSRAALNFGAEGIGLCRTEHMFFDPERISAVREMIFAKNKEDREKALAKILPFQKKDFIEIFEVMQGHPVNIRLLDPPLHEFLPQGEKETKNFADYMKITISEVKERADALHEFNPMLGHRGCRLGITYPEIYQMQIKAIVLAAIDCAKKGIEVMPEIMIPLVAHVKELKILREQSEFLIKDLLSTHQTELKYKIGTMIELPRAAITADQIALEADFFSFGTNDLTQTTFGLSRDDAGKFLPDYISNEILSRDPFVSIDRDGVGYLVKLATKLGREVNPKMSIGICGEHGGETNSVYFCHEIGLDYVSCSPFRVPIARLAAAQAAIIHAK
jgi:pyruvate, orthophosphate dikinase